MADVPLMSNPMTTAGDIIQGGASGAPARLAIGTAGQILKVNAGATALEYGVEAGGSGSVVMDSNIKTDGDVALTSSGWQNFDTGTDITLAAASGDWVEVGLSLLASAVNNTLAWDVVTVVSAAPVTSLAGKIAVASRPANGAMVWYCPNSSGTTGINRPQGGSIMYQLGAGDVSGGNVLLRVQVNPINTTSRTVSANTNTPFEFWAKVYS